MRHVEKLILIVLLTLPVISGCGGNFSAPPDRRGYQADRVTYQPEQLKRDALERLQDSVNSADPLVQMRAIESCVELRLSNAPSICIQAVSSPEPALQFAGAMGLLQLPTPGAESVLKKLLASRDPSVRLAAIGALRRLGQRQHSGELIAALDSRDAQTRGNALIILGRLGDESAIPAIRRVLAEDATERIQLQAAEALVLLGDEKILLRLQWWRDSRIWQQRIFAVELMGRVQDKERFVPHLLQGLTGPNQLVQLQSARSLGRLGQRDGFDRALRYLHPSRQDRQVIAREMRMGTGEPEFAERMAQIRSLAAMALGELGNWDAAAALGEALKDRNPQVALAGAFGALRLLQKTNMAQIQTVGQSGAWPGTSQSR